MTTIWEDLAKWVSKEFMLYQPRLLRVRESRPGGAELSEFIQHFAVDGIPEEFLGEAYRRFQRIAAVADMPIDPKDPIRRFPYIDYDDDSCTFGGFLQDLANEYGVDYGFYAGSKSPAAKLEFCADLQKFLEDDLESETGDRFKMVAHLRGTCRRSRDPTVDDWAFQNLKTVGCVVRFIHVLGSRKHLSAQS